MSLHGAGPPLAISYLLGRFHYFLLACTLLKPRVKYYLKIFMHEGVSSVDYINSREMFCEMMLEANLNEYLIFVQMFTKTLITLEPL
jgi:hypothetical protein